MNPSPPCLLCLDTATEVVHLALTCGGDVHAVAAGGGAQSSRSTLPAAQALLAQAGVGWADVQAIGFGRGPGAFTGLRTACSVAQGLALALDRPVLALDTLMAIAEDARLSDPGAWAAGDTVWVVQDARMNELYVAAYVWDGERWRLHSAPALWDLGVPRQRWGAQACRLAGNALEAQAAAFEGIEGRRWPQARPTGRALAALAQQAWEAGEGLDAALALPLYVRDKVAQTTAERQAGRAV